jgi:hypothetical protein
MESTITAGAPRAANGRTGEAGTAFSRRRQATPWRSELARCSASASKWGGRPGSNRRRGDHDPGCFRLHHGHHEAGTTGLEPAASRLTSERSARLSYAPEGSAGGIRTHGLELMRLARTASPLPRKSGWQESNLRPPAPEAGGVPSPLQPGDEVPPAGLEPAASGLRTRRHPVRPRGQAPAAGFEPALRN